MAKNKNKTMGHFLHGLFVLALCCLLPWGQSLAYAQEQSARDLVITTTERLVQGLKEGKEAIRSDVGFAYKLADETVIPHIDFPRITQWVTGKYWRQASPEQRERLTQEFRELLTRSYVTAMVNYTDQILAYSGSVHYPPTREEPGARRVAVPMIIDLEAGQKAMVQYLMHRTADGWKIYDVKVEGISLTITYRSTFSQEISRGGIDGLIKALSDRNDRMDVLVAAP